MFKKANLKQVYKILYKKSVATDPVLGSLFAWLTPKENIASALSKDQSFIGYMLTAKWRD